MAGSENTTTLPGCINGLPKRGTCPGTHPDAELLFAWEAFQAAATAYQCAPDGETSRYVLMLESIGERIETFRPKTLDGAKIQLRCLLTKYLNADCAWDTLVFDDDPDQDFYDAVDDDPHAGALWNLIRPGDSLLDRIARRIHSRRGSSPGAHPDSMLLAAWDGYIEAMRAYARVNAVPGASDADLEPFSRALSTFTRKIEETPARTMAGIAIQLRYLFAALVESHGATDAAIFGKAPLEALAADLDDARHRMLWRMIEEAERAADAAKGRNAGAHASTLIPALRLTFADASAKVLALLGEYQTAAGTRPDDPPDHLVVEASKLRRAVFTAPPQTPADALAVLNLLADGGAGLADGNRVDGQETAVTLLRDFMARQAASEQPV